MSNQYLKLRRSSVPGKTPTTSSLELGEIALNTYDGLAFMKKSGSSGEEIVVIGSTEGAFTGSFSGSFIGQFSGSFSGSGADLSNIPASAIVGLNLSQISSGSFSASISEQGLLVNTRVVAPSFTGSLFGTSSWAQNAISSSFATSASFAISSSFARNATSASFATTASFAQTTPPVFPFTGSAIISGSLTVTGSTNLSGSVNSTVFSTNADTLIITGSLLLTGSMNVVGLITGTITNAISASYIDGGFY